MAKRGMTDTTIGVLVGAAVSIASAVGGAIVGANLAIDGASRQQTRELQALAYSEYLAANSAYYRAQWSIARDLPDECLEIALGSKVSTDCQPSPELKSELDAAVSVRYLAVRELDMLADEDVAKLATEIEVRHAHVFNTSGVSVAPWIAQRELDRRNGETVEDDDLNGELVRAMSCTISGRAFLYDESGMVVGTEGCG